MSLTTFVKMTDVKDKLKPFRPPPPRKIGVPIKVAHRAKDHASAIGTAFDYLIRFELERRAPHLANGSKQWIAESAPSRIKRADLSGGSAAEIEEQIGATLFHARDLWKAHIGNKNPSHADMEMVATYAMRLAKIDPLFRRLVLTADYDEVDSESVGELLDLLAIVPWHEFVHSEMQLNPNFPASSHVGGADGDLITGDMLVDFKTVGRDDHDIQAFDQLLGYYLLANHFPGRERDLVVFPEINRVAIYYSRHGFLWSLHTSFWTNQSGFPELKEWFFSRAKEVFASPAVLQGRNQKGERVIVAKWADLEAVSKPGFVPILSRFSRWLSRVLKQLFSETE
jgi:hypothetical protein